MKIYSIDDRIKIKIKDIVITIAPLTFKQKMEVQASLKEDISLGTYLALRFGIKEVDGLEDINGKPYHLDFEDNKISERCADELLNVEVGSVIASICVSLLDGIPKEIINPTTGNKMEGVEIINP